MILFQNINLFDKTSNFVMIQTIIITALLWVSMNRTFETQMKFSNFGKSDGWIFLDKMSFAPGTVEYRIRTSPKGIPYGAGGPVILQAIPEDKW